MNVIASRFPAVRKPLTEIDLCGGSVRQYPATSSNITVDFSRSTPCPRARALPNGSGRNSPARRAAPGGRPRRGLIHLVQRRHRSDDYSYLAIARPKPRQASVSLSSLLLAEVA